MIRFACPSCGAVFTANDEKGGKTGSCSKCKAQFIIPEAIQPTVPTPPRRPEPPPERPQIPVHVPPRTAPQPRQPAPVAKVIRDEDDDQPRRRSSPRDNDDDDDRPRRRTSSRRNDDDDDTPRRRPSSRRDEDDDRPRRRRDEVDDYDDRPRRKKPKQSGLALAAGIILVISSLLIGTIAYLEIDKMKSSGYSSSGEIRLRRPSLPPERQKAADSAETALTFLSIFAYGSIVVALAFLAGGVGMIIHQHFGRFAAMGASALSVLMLLMYIIALFYLDSAMSAVAALGGSSFSGSLIPGTILRFIAHGLPILMTALTVFRYDVVKKFR